MNLFSKIFVLFPIAPSACHYTTQGLLRSNYPRFFSRALDEVRTRPLPRHIGLMTAATVTASLRR